MLDTTIVREDSSTVSCTIYLLQNINPEDISLQEGDGFEVLPVEEAIRNPGLTDLCRTAVAEYLKVLRYRGLLET